MGVPPSGLTPDEYADSLARLVGIGCPTPSKYKFASFDAAINYREGRPRKGMSLYPYRCQGTAHWHLTKRPQPQEPWEQDERQA